MRTLNTKIAVALLTVVVILTGVQSLKIIKHAADAYIFTYPLVVMDQTRKGSIMDSAVSVNQLVHLRSFPDHNFRSVVRANNDTVYTSTWFDLSQEPQIISVPKIDRYYVLPFMDAWTNVFDYIGTRSTGSEAGDYVLVGPNYQGELPKEMKVIKAPTNMVWMVARFMANGKADIDNVAKIQDQLKITALSNWKIRGENPSTIASEDSSSNNEFNPKAEVDALTIREFFKVSGELLKEQPHHEADTQAINNLAELNMTIGTEFNIEDNNSFMEFLIEQGASIANKKLHEQINSKEGSPKENAWIVWRDTLGKYGTNYNVRAGVALAALGALPVEEAAYASANTDINGKILHGSHRYKIHFEKGQLPPVDAFWSVTMYDAEGYLIESTINRYAIGDRDNLTFNQDGSLDIILQHQQPDMSENWLPTPDNEFSLILRLYRPKSDFANGQWQVPVITQI